MNKDSGPSTILWWLGWIALTILAFFVSCVFWTGFIADHVGPMSKEGVPFIWVAAVFGSWMVLLVPLIILMYNKVDRSYEDARMGRETTNYQKTKQVLGVRGALIEPEKRVLAKDVRTKLKHIPNTIHKGHLVHATLRDGRKVPNVFIYNKKELLGVYDVSKIDFDGTDIVDVTAVKDDQIPDFRTEKWLRLDGIGIMS